MSESDKYGSDDEDILQDEELKDEVGEIKMVIHRPSSENSVLRQRMVSQSSADSRLNSEILQPSSDSFSY